MNKQYYLNHSKIDVLFKQTKEDFVVTEIPLYEFSGEGEHLIIKFRKKSWPRGMRNKFFQNNWDVKPEILVMQV